MLKKTNFQDNAEQYRAKWYWVFYKTIENKFMKTRSILFALVAGTTLLVSCTEETPATPKSKVLVTHASYDAPGVDLLVDNTVINTAALTYPNNTGYVELNAGTRNIKVNVSGTTTTVINADITFEENKNYSLFACNAVAALEAILTEDNLSSPAAGNAHVRFIHLSPDAPAVDVAVDGGSVVFGDYIFKEASAFAPLPAGSYDLEVRLAGTSTVALDLDPITLEAGKIYTVFAKGSVSGSGATALGAEIIVNN